MSISAFGSVLLNKHNRIGGHPFFPSYKSKFFICTCLRRNIADFCFQQFGELLPSLVYMWPELRAFSHHSNICIDQPISHRMNLLYHVQQQFCAIFVLIPGVAVGEVRTDNLTRDSDMYPTE